MEMIAEEGTSGNGDDNSGSHQLRKDRETRNVKIDGAFLLARGTTKYEPIKNGQGETGPQRKTPYDVNI